MARTPDLPPLDFAGFDAPRYTQTPDVLFDELLPYLSEAELKVLLYIIRRTFGFKKEADAISISQMVYGIVKADGSRLDWGAGCSESSVKRGIRGLLEKGLIRRENRRSPERGDETPIYRLRMRGDPRGPERTPGEGQIEPPGEGQPDPRPGSSLTPNRGPESTPQETGQQTAEQEDGSPDILERLRTPPYSAFIAAVVLDHARELGAAGRGPAGVSEALRAWAASGLPEVAFVDHLHAARAAVHRQQRPGLDKWGLYLQVLHTTPPSS